MGLLTKLTYILLNLYITKSPAFNNPELDFIFMKTGTGSEIFHSNKISRRKPFDIEIKPILVSVFRSFREKKAKSKSPLCPVLYILVPAFELL